MSEAIVYPGIGDVARQEEFLRPFLDLAARLKELSRDHEIVYIRNPGNLGDGLIALGTIRFLEDFGIPFRELPSTTKNDRKTIAIFSLLNRLSFWKSRLLLYGGGGAWGSAYFAGYKMVKWFSPFFSRCVVLPSTFGTVIVKRRGITYYCRDTSRSREMVEKAGIDFNFCHDMALYLANVPSSSLLANRAASPKGIGFVLRQDRESRIRIDQQFPNQDISGWGNAGGDMEPFLRHIDGFEEVVTDRLHVAIGAILLGKRVHLIRGGYFKIEAIYNASIAPFFKNCTLIDDEAVGSLIERSRNHE